jgi:uncharacterized RDD family membrane protein YckC
MEQNAQTDNQEHLFETEVQFTEASQGSRFFNLLIDFLFMRFALSYATGYVIGYVLSIIAPDFLLSLAYASETSGEMILFSLILGYFNFIVYYTFCEALFNGYTLGKIITGTRAIRLDGNKLTFKDALLRSLSRIVPFEIFSGLGSPCNPWHDTWTKTWVIKAR